MTSTLRNSLLSLLVAVAAFGTNMAAAAPAAASTVQVDGATLTYDAAPGEANRLTLSVANGTVTVTDTGATVSVGSGCTLVSATKATCPSLGLAAMSVSTGDMNDTASVSGSISTVFYDGPGNDTMNGGSAGDLFVSDTGADALHGGGGVDAVDYSARTAPVTASLDSVAGDGESGEGDNDYSDIEVILGGAANDTLTGSFGNNDLYGGGGADTLRGGSGNDRLYGGAGADSLNGDGGNDLLDGGSDGDTIAGGSGTDNADYSFRSAAVSLSLDGQANDGESGESDNIAPDVENLAGGAGDDTLAGNASNNVLAAGPGDDLLDGGDGNDNLQGSVGNDRLRGGGGGDTLDGGAGDDRLDGGDGNDSVQGSTGNDLLYADSGSDTIAGGDGEDTADYSGRSSTLTITLNNSSDDGSSGERDNVKTDVEDVLGGSGADKLTGSGGDNVLSGGDSGDTVDGGGGNDTLRGGAGDDRMLAGLGNDVLDGGDGNDLADYSTEKVAVTVTLDGQANDGENGERDNVSAERVTGGAGGDTLVGDDAANVLIGGGGADHLVGGGAGDSLQGSDGDDILDGSSGADDLVGGSGRDTADYSTRMRALGVFIDNQANDGEAGEGDNVHQDVETVVGGGGNDRLVGSSAANDLQGGPGDDLIDGGAGADSIAGGPGIDTVDYSNRTGTVYVTMDNQANDGEAGEHDNVQSAIDVVRGGRAGDVLSGSNSSNTIYGGPGNDTINGYGGDDVLSGEAGDDRINGGSGRDRIDGGTGNDSIDASDKYPDLVRCGSGRDSVSRDSKKDKLANCEGTHRSSGKNNTAPKAPTPGAIQPVGRKNALVRLASVPNVKHRYPSVRGHVRKVTPCTSFDALKPTWGAAARAFGLKWQVLAAVTQIESGFGCNMGPSSAGAIGWTQFMPATWRRWGMDADGDHKANPYDSVDAIFSTARYLRASGAPHSYRRALFAYNHAGWYVKDVLRRAKLFGF
jgi:Ca2+-binding RTX toxin-like protein